MKAFTKYRNWIRTYIYDSSINIKERTFILFSSVVLFALFTAIPCGIIMHEPISATVSTLIGAIFFLVCVVYSYKKNRINQARVAISFILIFIFLPTMYFTNGGALSGAPIWLLLGTVYIAMILEGKFKIVMLTCELVVMTICWIISYIFPKLIIGYTRGGNYFDSIAGLIIVSVVIYLMIAFQNRVISSEEEHKKAKWIFDKAASSLVNAVDARDKYAHGHSARVAKYARKIAEFAGKYPAECEEIYYVALLHDVGKIGVSEAIINKEGQLTEEEYEQMKEHSALGAAMLQDITEYPYISIGAYFHHERYDGKGYPRGLKGTDIPEIARIIAVADAYDAMTSKRSYRDPLPQIKVREEFIEGSGTQFDPEFASIMIHLIDIDEEYEMREREALKDLSDSKTLVIADERENVSDGILINANMATIDLRVSADKRNTGVTPKASLILFDSLDGQYHGESSDAEDNLYYEYAEIAFDGTASVTGARKSETRNLGSGDSSFSSGEYRIEAVRLRDHALVKIVSWLKTVEVIIALPDSSRYLYIGLSGEHCRMSGIMIEKAEEVTGEDYIPRIAEEVSYINVPEGDVPNIQIDGYRTATTKGIPLTDGMTISFHAMSLPTARLVWHCPAYIIYASDDGTVDGDNYKEYSFVRLDGESWEAENVAENELVVDRKDFEGWESWKAYNKEGYDCTISFTVQGERIISTTENDGISIKDTTKILSPSKKIFVALSGDQCALTGITIGTDNNL